MEPAKAQCSVGESSERPRDRREMRPLTQAEENEKWHEPDDDGVEGKPVERVKPLLGSDILPPLSTIHWAPLALSDIDAKEVVIPREMGDGEEKDGKDEREGRSGERWGGDEDDDALQQTKGEVSTTDRQLDIIQKSRCDEVTRLLDAR